MANDLTFSSFAKRRSEQENVFTTNNTRPNQKINRLNLESERTHFDIWFNNGNFQCTVRPLFFIFLKNHNRSIKNKTKLHQTIRKNNPRNHSIKSTQRQTQQASTTKCNIFEYYNIANSNGFRANRKYAFHKNSTQIHKTKQHNLYFEVTILQTRKSKTLYFLIIGNSQENIFNLE